MYHRFSKKKDDSYSASQEILSRRMKKVQTEPTTAPN
jgi:hypothetical protein